MSVREYELLPSRRAVRGHDVPPKVSLREDELERARRAQRKRQKQVKRKHKRRPSALDAPLSLANDNQCLSFFQWCSLNGFSERTGRRILASGTGPKVVQLSAKRIGITIGANREWQGRRARG